MTPEQRKEAERKKAAHKASKGIVEGADFTPAELEQSFETIETMVKPRRTRKSK
jgi:hypothetical protein